MYKKLILIAVGVLIVVAVVAFVFVKPLNKNSPAKTSSFNFYCQEGTLKAEFGKNYVVLTFVDGKNILLPQTISGSGIRYELGTTTFISKGDNASLTQNGKTTYTNCLTGNLVSNNKTNTFTDRSQTFSFSYPSQFVLSGGDFGYSQSWTAISEKLGLVLVIVNIPRTFEPKTNFGEAKFTVGTSADPDAIKNCLSLAYPNMGTTSEETINGRKFTKLTFTDVGAGNIYDTTSYRAVYNDQCYAVEYTIHSGNIYNYDPSQGIKEFNKIKVVSVLEGMVRSFKFINQ